MSILRSPAPDSTITAKAVILSATHSSVILLNYTHAQDTLACLDALAQLATPPLNIIVVDNNSPDDSVRQIMDGWQANPAPVLLPATAGTLPALPEGQRHVLLALPENRGFAAGNNAAIALALQNQNCRAVWLLNNDTQPATDALDALCARLNQPPHAGMAGSTLLYTHDKERVQTLAGESLRPLLGCTRYIGHGQTLAGITERYSQATVEQQLDSITGASMLLRRKVLEEVGLLDEQLFLYLEEVEYCTRVRRAGFLLAWAPDSIVYHTEGASTGATSAVGERPFARPDWVDYLVLRNRLYVTRKHFAWALPSVLAACLAAIASRIWRGQWRRIPLLLQALWHGLRGRKGRPDTILPAQTSTQERQ